MPHLSFRARLTLRWTVVFGLVLAAASVAIFLGLRRAAYAELDRHLRTLASSDVAAAFDQPVSPHVHDLPSAAVVGGAYTEKLVQVFDAQRRMVVSTEGRAQRTAYVDEALLDAGFRGEAPVASVTVDNLPLRVIVLSQTHNGQTYVFAVGVVITELLASLGNVQRLLVLVWLISTAATAAVGFALASTALLPVRRITRRAMDIAALDLPARLEEPAVKDEIGTMTLALNSLIERLHSALDANRRFAADAAHELRSPVAAMAGEIDVTLRRPRTAEEYQQTLQVVRERLITLTALIGDLMLLVRAQERRDAVVLDRLPLVEILKGAIDRTAAMAAERKINVRLNSVERLVVNGDARLLGRVFDNLLENAIRYNREGGQVTLSATLMDAASSDDRRIRVLVQDTGIGIPAADRDRVFDRFYRVDASRNRHTGGAGLGLAIAREVLALFDGAIHIATSSPEGTTIAIDLRDAPERPDLVFAAS